MIEQHDYSFLGPLNPREETQPLLRIGIAAAPDFTLFSLSNLVEVLRHSADEADFSRQLYCSWALLSHSTDKIRASCGLEISPIERFADPAKFDYVVILGGLLHSKTSVPDELYQYILKAHDQGIPLIGLCTGQFLFAKLGLLNERKCAVHFSLETAIMKLFPQVIPVTTEPIVQDGPFITCPGGLATLNLAMTLVSQHCGAARTNKVLHYLMAENRLDDVGETYADGGTPALSCNDKRVRRAVVLMHQKTIETISVADIAHQVGTTKRELTRLFNKHLRMPPGEYWRTIRLNSARWMVVNTDRSVAQIASDCGFTDSSHLIRWFKRSFDTTPKKMRGIHGDLGVN
ncbi:MAG: helix-turn-helix domain-containing protein [Alphaproteobacteria bacterium]|nr:helix-turn-helix domain-containing protein [Alphaproteobacteria bacterium]